MASAEAPKPVPFPPVVSTDGLVIFLAQNSPEVTPFPSLPRKLDIPRTHKMSADNRQAAMYEDTVANYIVSNTSDDTVVVGPYLTGKALIRSPLMHVADILDSAGNFMPISERPPDIMVLKKEGNALRLTEFCEVKYGKNQDIRDKIRSWELILTMMRLKPSVLRDNLQVRLGKEVVVPPIFAPNDHSVEFTIASPHPTDNSSTYAPIDTDYPVFYFTVPRPSTNTDSLVDVSEANGSLSPESIAA